MLDFRRVHYRKITLGHSSFLYGLIKKVTILFIG